MSDQENASVVKNSKRSQAISIFNVELVKLRDGTFKSNKEFRKFVLERLKSEMGASVSSAATMYNEAKKQACAADPTLILGRDPSPVKVEAVITTTKKRVKKAVATTTTDSVVTNADGTDPNATTEVSDQPTIMVRAARKPVTTGEPTDTSSEPNDEDRTDDSTDEDEKGDE